MRQDLLSGITVCQVSPFAFLKAQLEKCTKFQGCAWPMHKDGTQALSRSKEARPFSKERKRKKERERKRKKERKREKKKKKERKRKKKEKKILS